MVRVQGRSTLVTCPERAATPVRRSRGPCFVACGGITSRGGCPNAFVADAHSRPCARPRTPPPGLGGAPFRSLFGSLLRRLLLRFLARAGHLGPLTPRFGQANCDRLFTTRHLLTGATGAESTSLAFAHAAGDLVACLFTITPGGAIFRSCHTSKPAILVPTGWPATCFRLLGRLPRYGCCPRNVRSDAGRATFGLARFDCRSTAPR